MNEYVIEECDLNSLEIKENIFYEVKLNHNNLTYCFKIYIKDVNDKLVIFSNGAIDPNKKSPPIYMRSSWIENINASCIFLDDPTTHENNLRLGWGQGTKENFVLEEWADIIKQLLKKFRFKEQNTYFYGSSAGGFMSIYYSILIPNTNAIANNPQTKVLNYLPVYVNKMLSYTYKVNKHEIIPSEFMYRLDLVEAIRYYNNIPKKIYYIQNYLCEGDMEKHYRPFIESLKEDEIDIKGLCVINYFNKNLGHNPLPQRITLRYIHAILDGKLDFKF